MPVKKKPSGKAATKRPPLLTDKKLYRLETPSRVLAGLKEN